MTSTSRQPTLVYQDSLFQQHLTGEHPENPQRIEAIAAGLAARGEAGVRFLPAQAPKRSLLKRVHSPEVLQNIEALVAEGGGYLDGDTVVSPRSLHCALAAGATATAATEQVLKGEAANALCLVRPPGHHATPSRSMGFCLFNNIAVAAQYALDEWQLNRILIVDWDVHHGNGTQDCFYASDQVYFFSVHRFPFYPGTGAADETGSGAGLGFNHNLPLELGVSREFFLTEVEARLHGIMARFKPELVLISAGFDAHHQDPVGSLGLHAEDFAKLTQIVMSLAAASCGGRVVSLLEGGYNPAALSESVLHHLNALAGSTPAGAEVE